LAVIEGVEGAVYHPSLSSDHLTLYFALEVGGVERIWMATRKDRGTTFYNALELPVVNELDTGAPFISKDDLSLYFHSARAGTMGRDIFVATRSAPNLDFQFPVRLLSLASASNDHVPWVADDQSSVVFVSTRGALTEDLWTARRSLGSQEFTTPVPLGGVNTAAREGGPYLTSNTLAIYFTSDRDGSLDVFLATRTHTSYPFSEARSLEQINSGSAENDPALSRDGAELFFVSDRSGVRMLYRALAECQ
jgi:Tol biopolymer transport system component